MTCCIVGLLLIMVFGRLRRVIGRVVGGRAEAPGLFAPVAQRPAPGQVLGSPVDSEPAVPQLPPADVLRYCAFGVVVCLVGMPVLVWMGAVQNTGSANGWLLRSACYVAVAIGALALGRPGTPWGAPRGAGTLLIVVGAVVFELTVIDMHVFGVIDLDPQNTLAYLAFHNIGPGLAIVGGLLLYGSRGRRAISDRSPRSTVTIAQPVASAVIVSSTPPITS